MTRDSVDFVRQGAFIALGMVLVQQSEASSLSMASTRTLYNKIIGDKHEDPMARFGAAVGQGLIDAGGRNVTINLQSRAGSKNTSAIVGMVLFCQFWYWYPLAHCASLAFEPTGIIGVNAEFQVVSVMLITSQILTEFSRPLNLISFRMQGQAYSRTLHRRNHPKRRPLRRLRLLFSPQLRRRRRGRRKRQQLRVTLLISWVPLLIPGSLDLTALPGRKARGEEGWRCGNEI